MLANGFDLINSSQSQRVEKGHGNCASVIDNQILKNNLVVAHWDITLKPLRFATDAKFGTEIWRIMNEKNLTKDYCIHRYAWPHLLMPNRSLFLVNQTKTGRTWSYLPVICSKIIEGINLPNHQVGPMAVITVDDARSAQILTFNCKMLLSKVKTSKTKVVTYACEKGRKHFENHLRKSYGILVTTPSYLITIFEQNKKHNLDKILNKKSLSFLVMDDYDLMREHNNNTQIDRLVNNLIDLYKIPEEDELQPQVIVISQHWSLDMLRFMKYSHGRLVLFGDFLEAAVFAKVPMTIKVVEKVDKWQNMLTFLQSRTCDGRTIIYCNSDNAISKVLSQLKMAAYDCIAVYNNTTLAADKKKFIEDWQHLPTKKIIIRSENCIELKMVQNAKYLLHFEFPENWGKFKNRFSSIAQNILDAESGPKVLLLIQKEYEDTNMLRHLKHFLSIHNMEPPKYITTSIPDNLRRSEERSAVMGRPFCKMLMTFGKCDEALCKSRHLLTHKDIVPDHLKEDIPTDGNIIIKVLKIYSPIHFAVHILMQSQPNSKEYRHLPTNSSKFRKNFLNSMNVAMKKPTERKPHWPPKLHDVCVIFKDSQYQRVRILKVSDFPKDDKIRQPLVEVIVQAMDTSTDIYHTKADQLYCCPKRYDKVPPNAINLRVLGFIPYNDESHKWSQCEVQQFSKTLMFADQYLKATVDFSLVHTVFIKDIETLPDNDGCCSDLLEYLTENKIAKKNEDIANKLRVMFSNIGKDDDEESEKKPEPIDLCFDFGDMEDDFNISTSMCLPNENIEPPNYEINKHSDFWRTIPINALINIEIENSREYGHGFYIREVSSKIEGIVQNQIEDYLHEKQPTCVTSMKNINFGDNFLIPVDERYWRAKYISLLRVEVNPYQFLLVDVGKYVQIHGNERIYEIPDELDSLLTPFQSVYCEMAGIDMLPNQNSIKANGKYLFILAKRECLSPFEGVHGYEVILYESAESCFSDCTMLNKYLVLNNLAKFNSYTKSDLEHDLAEQDFV